MLTAQSKNSREVISVANSMLTAIYHILENHTPYESLGPDHFSTIRVERARARHVKAVECLGFKVNLEAAA